MKAHAYLNFPGNAEEAFTYYQSIFGGELRPQSQEVEVRMKAPLSIEALPTGEACVLYGSIYQELLRGLTGFEGALLHARCRSRGEEACVWRTAVAEVYE
jgi:uncharacterized glyoxalase superfamily protein PhnB